MFDANPSEPPPHAEGRWARHFVTNVLWTWAGVAAAFFTGFILQPYIIRKLGDHRYGIWALAFAFIDSFMLFDFGFKSATVNFVSRARAEGNAKRINEIVNTSLFYFLGIAAVLVAATWAGAPYLDRVLKITPEYRGDFIALVRLIAVGWGTALGLGVFNAGIEAFQRFKTQNSISILYLILRSGGCALAVYFGHGLVLMGFIVVCAQVVNFGLLFASFRRAFPELRISPALMRPAIWKDLAGYGVHAFVAYLGAMLLGQGPPLLIGHFWGDAFAGYYALPSRLLQAAVDLITRIGNVTMPSTAELAGREEWARIAKLGTYLNRYCFALFVPVSVFLAVYGRELIRAWVGPAFAAQAAPLLIPFVLLTAIAVAGQFNSSVILFGLAKHRIYARSLAVEAVLSLVAMAAVLPKFGILGAAWVAAAFGIADRGVLAPFWLSRELKFSLAAYMRGIYAIPALLALPAAGYAYWMKAHWLAGRNWTELFAAAALIAAPYYCACYFAILDRQHRALLERWALARLGGRRPAGPSLDRTRPA